ncbi:putative two-component system response regulator [[Actinomadura] parvosata subsp. kistnae]|nr:putative two-component system response regulator [Actinomadura parvosata subsp. kistnae]
MIAEDDALLREGLAMLLGGEGYEVVAAVANPQEFLAAVARHSPDVAVVDVRMPPTHTDEGIRAAVEARRAQPGLAVPSQLPAYGCPAALLRHTCPDLPEPPPGRRRR